MTKRKTRLEPGESARGEKAQPPAAVRYRRLSSVAAPVRSLAKKLLGGKAVAEASVMLDWPSIVGTEIAARCQPRRLARGRGANAGPATLHLTVDAPFALEIQYSAAQIVERVNRYLGYPAVARLALHQGELLREEKPQQPRIPPLAPPVRQQLDQEISGIADEELRQALGRLGQAVLAKPGPDRR